jgi:hypothetical protein
MEEVSRLREAAQALLDLIGPNDSRVYASDKEVIALRAALSGAQGGDDGWLPIETAPKDGTRVDLWAAERERYENERVPGCWWLEDRWVHQATIFDDEQPLDLATIHRATHWRPLPPAPLEGLG